MKNQIFSKSAGMLILMFAFTLAAFAQKPSPTPTPKPTPRHLEPVGGAKAPALRLTSTTPDRGTSIRISEVAKARIIRTDASRRAFDPTRFTSPVFDGTIIICDLPGGGKNPDPFSHQDGLSVGILNINKATKFLAADFYTVNLGQSGTDANGTPLYYLTLINSSGIQSLSIGAKTNGAAGNSTGLGAKKLDNRGPKPAAGSPNSTIDRMAKFGARFIVEGKLRSLKTDGLDAAIMELVAQAAVEGCQTCDCNGRKVYVCGNNGSCTKECARDSDDPFRDATKPKN